jgi:homoserine O-acetyltransferase/O-succinyltransferase
LGDFALESAVTLPSAKLAYRTFGTLSPAKDNAVLFPHMYSGTHLHMERFVAKGMALDPDKYFIVLPGQFGNGLSSSLSNTPPPFQPGRLPERDDRGRRARPASLDRAESSGARLQARGSMPSRRSE